MVDSCVPLLLGHTRYLSLLCMVVLHGIHAGSKVESVTKDSGVAYIQKKVGETVELTPGLPTKGLTMARWMYKGMDIVDWTENNTIFQENTQFKDRVLLNCTNFKLTIKDLTVSDSGVFRFVSEKMSSQNPTASITLEVHEFMRRRPILTVSITWHPVNMSCTVSLECSATGYRNVRYTWLPWNQSNTGPNMQFLLTPSEGDTTVNCTASNVLSSQSASQTVRCDNTTPNPDEAALWLVLYVAVPAGCAVVIVIIAAVVAYHCQQRRAGRETHDNTTYAYVTDNVSMKNVQSDSMENPSSVYETIEDPVELRTTATTVYDEIQFGRPTGGAASPL